MDQQTSAAIFQQAGGPRFEIIPANRIIERTKASLPSKATLSVTCSPTKGIDTTIETSIALAPYFSKVVPHIAARMLHDEEHLKTVLSKLQEYNLDDIFVIGGDYEEPIGPYKYGRDVLEDLDNHEHGLNRIGIPGYPEGHPNIDQSILDEDLAAKAPYADYVVTQMCFNTEQVFTWLQEQRSSGLQMPFYLGIPGPVKLDKLIRIAPRIGVTDSFRFLKGNLKLSGKLLRGYDPGELVQNYIPYLNESKYGIAGFHTYTFNELTTLQKESSRIPE